MNGMDFNNIDLEGLDPESLKKLIERAQDEQTRRECSSSTRKSK